MERAIGLYLFVTFTLIFVPRYVRADEVMPAMSEDLGSFDQQTVAGPSSKPVLNRPKSTKDNFGSLVTKEARKLKDSDAETRKSMASWTSDQRRKDVTAADPSSTGNGMGPENSNSSNAHGKMPNPESQNGKGHKAGAGHSGH